MEWKEYFKCVTKGTMVSLLITVLFTAIFSLVMTYVNLGEGILGVVHVVVSCVALVIGSIFAAKSHKRNGWIVGLGVAIMFYIALLLMGFVLGAEEIFSIYVLIKLGLCIVIGVLAGMLGINL